MKIVDRYLITHFLRPMAACCAIFTILVFLGHFFDRKSIFTDYHARVGDVLMYLVLDLPYWLNVIFPVVTLLSLMFSLGPLQQRGEFTALRGAGISSVRLFAPFLAIGVLISALSLLSGLIFIPYLSTKADTIYAERIKRRPMDSTLRDHLVVAGLDHRRFTIETLNTQNGRMTNIIIDQFDDNEKHISTLSAREGQYQDGRWTFRDGNFLQFDGTGAVHQESFQEKVLDIRQKPEEFVYDDRNPANMTLRELLKRIRHLGALGVPSFRERVSLHLKFSFPFANVIVILLGIPFALKSVKKGNVHAIAYAFGATFLYWGTISVFQSYGDRGYVPAWISAWAANILFGLLAVWFLRRTLKV